MLYYVFHQWKRKLNIFLCLDYFKNSFKCFSSTFSNKLKTKQAFTVKIYLSFASSFIILLVSERYETFLSKISIVFKKHFLSKNNTLVTVYYFLKLNWNCWRFDPLNVTNLITEMWRKYSLNAYFSIPLKVN